MESTQAHECRYKDWLLMATRTAGSVARASKSSVARNLQPRLAAQRTAAPAVPLPIVAPDRLRLAAARTGDHPSIHSFLLSVFHGPTAAEFHAQLDEPGYEPSDRLIVKEADRIAAHLRLARQTIQIAAATLPAARFMDLATAPEYRSRGLATALLAAGERAAAERGILVGLTRTRVPELFARQGWALCGRHEFATAAPRGVLAEISASAPPPALPAAALLQPVRQPVFIRPLRRIELAAVVQLYAAHSQTQAGWPVRDEAYWEWLLARGACENLYVASTATESADYPTLLQSIIGYACVRQSRIVELVTAAGREGVARQLAERVCADAREDDGWSVRFDAPARDPLQDLFRRAGGQRIACQELGGEVFMAKLIDPLAALRRLTNVISTRAAAAGIVCPAELGLELRTGGGRKVPGSSGVIERFRICVGKDQTKIETGGPSRHAISLEYRDLAPLLLADLGAAGLAQAGRLKATTAKAGEIATALLPGNCWWRPPLDDLLA